jgi:GTPase SAR1 family protein
MPHDQAYYEAEKKIEEALKSGTTELDLRSMELIELPESLRGLTQLQSLNLAHNNLTILPEWLGELTQLQLLDFSNNQLATLPESMEQLTQLKELDFSKNQLATLPESSGSLNQLEKLDLMGNKLAMLPDSLGLHTNLRWLNLYNNELHELPDALYELSNLRELGIGGNPLDDLSGILSRFRNFKNLGIEDLKLTSVPSQIGFFSDLEELWIGENLLTDLPSFIVQLDHLQRLQLDNNPLNPDLAEADKQGLDAVKAYLRAKAGAQIILNEAKLILVGEGEVGKTCLLGALRDEPFVEGLSSTHGIDIKPVKLTDPESQTEITLNGWDFGGQRVYRPTHQLFFSAPAVYLVVWKPREGPQQGFVKEWIQLVKRREPDAKILVVATHGGPGGRKPDIDRQELWDAFGKETVLEFFHVESKPDKSGKRRGIEELKKAIARVAAGLPEMGRSVPQSFQQARAVLEQANAAYLPLAQVFEICREQKMDNEVARLFFRIEHRLGHLIHYEHDPALQDIVVLKPDWLATAMSFVLDDDITRAAHGLVRFSRLGQLWDDPEHNEDFRYPPDLHTIFLRLMERFDLSYRVAELSIKGESDPQSLIAQLVPDNRPDSIPAWANEILAGDTQQEQICRIVDKQTGQSAPAEGLFYQLIVRLHKYSLGRTDYRNSIHWQRGLVLDDDYNGRALLEHTGNDVRITVRAPYPERFLAMLTEEIKYLVESFWEGLLCEVMVPCLNPKPCKGLLEVGKLIENKKRGRPEQPCPICNEWQDIDQLLRNAPAARPISIDILFAEFTKFRSELGSLRPLLEQQHNETLGRFDGVDMDLQRLFSQGENTLSTLMQTLTDEAKEGPRLFSFVPVERTIFNPKQWTNAKFRLILWCEHSRLPLPALNGENSTKGIYEIELTREWFKKVAPVLKVLNIGLSLILPVAASGVKLTMSKTAYESIENQLDFGKEIIDATLNGSDKVGDWLESGESTDLEHGEFIRADGATLRELQSMLKVKDPGFGGLVRVLNKRQEFLWVHEQFAGEY